jgi:hypothetical protein
LDVCSVLPVDAGLKRCLRPLSDGNDAAMSERGVTGGSTQFGAMPDKAAHESHVHVREEDLLVVLEAAQQLHSTPLITLHDHERLGRAIDAVRRQLESKKPFAKGTRLRP